jgi:bifunctional UDP-N-acetylglucosamine pyrophosphorylase/glucosamine-1-phosphate N-acetyltransferase
MADNHLICVILAAGQGTRMKSDIPKSLHQIAGRSLIEWVIESAEQLNPKDIFVVVPPDCPEMLEKINPYKAVVQEEALGTGDAVSRVLPNLKGFEGEILVLLGDMPLLSSAMMAGVIETKRENKDTGVSVLGVQFDQENIPAFGRLVMEGDVLEKIVEDKDCSAKQKEISLCNTGAICIDGKHIEKWVSNINTDNAQSEFYLTDLPEIAKADGLNTRVAILYDTEEASGINTRSDLAKLEALAQRNLREKAMANGVTLLDPKSVYFSWDTKLGKDIVIEPNVFFGNNVTLENGVTIKSFSHIESSHIHKNSVIGPFARLRGDSVIGEGSDLGNFVEVKKSTLGKGVKAKHLAYIGDAELGDNVNYSCGAITVNYDGFSKHKTVVGSDAMIGSNVNLIAPVNIGKGAYIAAGSTVSKDVPDDALAVAREKQVIIEGWVSKKKKKMAS